VNERARDNLQKPGTELRLLQTEAQSESTDTKLRSHTSKPVPKEVSIMFFEFIPGSRHAQV